VFWEVSPHLREEVEAYGQADFEKEAWVSNVLLEWGSCGRVLHVEGVPAGYGMYAPPAAVPRAAAFPTAPVSADAILLTALKVLPEFTGVGLGRVLVQEVVKDLTRRGVTAVEAFADAEAGRELEGGSGCVIPADFLRSVGFKTVAPHPTWPRMRLELQSGLSWKADVEAALEQLLGTVSVRTAEPALGRAR
jgi:GNAT superfamily N-acetyltransferase